jgi:hypothetical protein
MIDSLFGNASQVDSQKVQAQLTDVLVSGEQVTMAYKLVRDMFVFTNKRLILIDKQGLTGNKVEYFTIPYKSIKCFAVETAGQFDRDAELKIWLSGDSAPSVTKELRKGIDIVGLQKMLAYYVLS